MPLIAVLHTSLLPPAYSPRMPCLPLALSQAVAAVRRSWPMVELTHVALVPEPSESRYWCIWYSSLLLGSVSAPMVAPLLDDVHVHAPVQSLPSTRSEEHTS